MTTPEPELLACPFRHTKTMPHSGILRIENVSAEHGVVVVDLDDGWWQVACCDCYARGPAVRGRASAIAAWNRRVSGKENSDDNA